MTVSGIKFDEIRIPLFTGDWRERIAEYTPAGRVPVLIDGDLSVWDSTAIIAHLQETDPRALGWPPDRTARALARSICAEMHSGFLALREELPQNLRQRRARPLSELSGACRDQIIRIEKIWAACRRDWGAGGPWLFGELSTADVMFAPVALRFVSYMIEVEDQAAEFIDAVVEHPAVAAWCKEAASEPESLDFIDNLTAASDSPLVLG